MQVYLYRILPLSVVKVMDKTIDGKTVIWTKFTKQGMRVWTGLNWLTTGWNAGTCQQVNELSNSIKGGGFLVASREFCCTGLRVDTGQSQSRTGPDCPHVKCTNNQHCVATDGRVLGGGGGGSWMTHTLWETHIHTHRHKGRNLIRGWYCCCPNFTLTWVFSQPDLTRMRETGIVSASVDSVCLSVRLLPSWWLRLNNGHAPILIPKPLHNV